MKMNPSRNAHTTAPKNLLTYRRTGIQHKITRYKTPLSCTLHYPLHEPSCNPNTTPRQMITPPTVFYHCTPCSISGIISPSREVHQIRQGNKLYTTPKTSILHKGMEQVFQYSFYILGDSRTVILKVTDTMFLYTRTRYHKIEKMRNLWEFPMPFLT